jgi:hypothetical protein
MLPVDAQVSEQEFGEEADARPYLQDAFLGEVEVQSFQVLQTGLGEISVRRILKDPSSKQNSSPESGTLPKHNGESSLGIHCKLPKRD